MSLRGGWPTGRTPPWSELWSKSNLCYLQGEEGEGRRRGEGERRGRGGGEGRGRGGEGRGGEGEGGSNVR